MMGWKVPLHCYFFFSSWFSDYVSRAPLLSDDKLNFHVLCIINPSLARFMPTPALSAAHAWIAKESSLQLELIDIPKKKKGKSLNLSHRLLNGLISRQSQASNAERQARQIESASCLWSFLVPNDRVYWHVFFLHSQKNYHSFASHKILLYGWKFRGISFNACRWLHDNNFSLPHLGAFDTGWKGMSEYLIFLSVFIDGFTIKERLGYLHGRLADVDLFFWAVYSPAYCEYIDAFFSPFALHLCLCMCNIPVSQWWKHSGCLSLGILPRHGVDGWGGVGGATQFLGKKCKSLVTDFMQRA